jgi:hypothetical protein
MLQKKLIFILIAVIMAGCQSAPASVPVEKLPTVSVRPTITALTATRAPATPMSIPFFLISTPTPTLVVPTATPTLGEFLTPTLMPTRLTSTRRLDIPIGGYYKFLIHKSKDGEELETYAEKYNTTVEAILYINYHLTNPVWEDVLFVVPINIKDVSGMPIFVVYEIKPEEEAISPDRLAAVLNVNAFDLRYYNGMLDAAGSVPRMGDLILVPWPRNAGKVRWH